MTGQTDDAEIAALYAATYPRLVGLLAAIGDSPGDAEEVVQEAFVQLLGRWDRVRHYDDAEAWVRSVAVRRLISRRRRRAVAFRGLARAAAGQPGTVAPPDADAVDVAAALRRLPVALRAAVLLYYVADLPVEGVAAELGVPVGTVKSRLSRARTALAPLLAIEEHAQEESDRA